MTLTNDFVKFNKMVREFEFVDIKLLLKKVGGVNFWYQCPWLLHHFNVHRLFWAEDTPIYPQNHDFSHKTSSEKYW